ncbi:MAG: hypothetical protein AAGI92_06480 [Pseudomonadota bacterium]
MARYFFAVIVGVIGAIVVHFGAIYLLPTLSANAAAAIVGVSVADGEFVEIGALDNRIARENADPFRVGICKFDLSSGVFRMRSDGDVPLWTIAVHGQSGTISFSATDRNVPGGQLNLAIVNQKQLREIRQSLPQDLENAVIVDTRFDAGFISMRAFEPDASYAEKIREFFANTSCEYVTYEG